MRLKLIGHDILETVLGLGPNLFYNSPMEACVVICRTAKPKARKGKILFINAVNEVTRERAQSFLTGDHIERIVAAYRTFKEIPGFTRVATLDEVSQHDGNLSIPLYVAPAESEVKEERLQYVSKGLPKAIEAWLTSSKRVRDALSSLLKSDGLNSK